MFSFFKKKPTPAQPTEGSAPAQPTAPSPVSPPAEPPPKPAATGDADAGGLFGWLNKPIAPQTLPVRRTQAQANSENSTVLATTSSGWCGL